MTHDELGRWLDAFGDAWKSNDPADIGALVTEQTEWHSGPFTEIFRDRQTLVDHWISTVNTHGPVETEYEILAVDGDTGISRYRASYGMHKTARVHGDGIFIIRLNDEGQCVEFHEWYDSQVEPLPEYR